MESPERPHVKYLVYLLDETGASDTPTQHAQGSLTVLAHFSGLDRRHETQN